jgi:predicted transport protein
MPLYQMGTGKAVQIKPGSFSKERDLQRLFETNLEELLGVRFIVSEFTTGDRQRGRIDTLGIDQDGNPTIIEFKKIGKDTVINQGLFYLDWLVDHKGDFTLVTQNKLGGNVEIDWSNPRLMLVAENFSDYDKYAVNRIGANISLWVYRLYGKDMLFLDQIFAASGMQKKKGPEKEKTVEADDEDVPVFTVEGHLIGKSQETIDLFEHLRERIFDLGDDESILEKAVKNYIVYKHGKNFCEIWVQASKLKIWVDIAPGDLHDPAGLARDVTKVGHWGTGDIEITLETPSQLDAIMAIVEQAYQQTV